MHVVYFCNAGAVRSGLAPSIFASAASGVMLQCCNAVKDQTDYSNLQTMIKTFEPYNNLWKTAGDWVSNKEADMKPDDVESASKFWES